MLFLVGGIVMMFLKLMYKINKTKNSVTIFKFLVFNYIIDTRFALFEGHHIQAVNISLYCSLFIYYVQIKLTRPTYSVHAL